MPLNGNVFTRLQSWVNNATLGIKIRADLMDQDTNDIASALTTIATNLATNISNLAAAAGAALIGYSPYGYNGLPTTVLQKLGFSPVYLEEWGAVGDGTSHPLSATYGTLVAAQAVYGAAAVALTDEIDGVAFQALITAGYRIRGMPNKTYLLTRGIQAVSGTKAKGAGRWSGAASTMKNTGTSTLKYAGAGGTDSYVVLFSDTPVSVQPTTSATANLQNVHFTDWTIDGGDLAQYGVIEVRVGQGNDLSRLTITNTRVCANPILLGFVTGSADRIFYKNRGAHAWFGKDIWSWGVSTSTDNVVLTGWFSYYSGCDQSGNPYNVFADSGTTIPTSLNPDVECGFAIYGARAFRMVNCQIAQSSGPALVVKPSLHGPIVIDGGYMEFNGRSSGSSRAWADWIITNADGGSWATVFRDISYSGTAPAHRLTGTQSSRIDQGPRWENCPIMGTMVADAAYVNYGLFNCDQTVSYAAGGGTPATPMQSLGGFQSEAAGDVVRFRSGVTGAVALAGATVAGTGWTYSGTVTFLWWRRWGSLVTFGGQIVLTAKSGTATGNIIMTGLPFTVKTGAAYNAAMATTKTGNFTSSLVSLTGAVNPGTTTVVLYARTGAAVGETALALADLSNTTSFAFCGSYVTDDA